MISSVRRTNDKEWKNLIGLPTKYFTPDPFRVAIFYFSNWDLTDVLPVEKKGGRYYVELCWPVIELRPTIKRRVEGVKDVLSYFARVISGWKELLSLSKFIDKNGIDIIWDKHFRTCYSPPVFHFPARYSPPLLCNMDAITMETARLPAIDLNNRGQAEWERWLAQALGPWIWQTWSNKGTRQHVAVTKENLSDQ
jgi:hypothetical protein